jgi:hypothetical protein
MWLVAIIGVAIRFLVKYLITKSLLYLGFGFLAYTGIETLMDQLESQVMGAYASLPSMVWQIVSLCGLDVAITIILSALAMVLQVRVLGKAGALLVNLGRS